MSQSQELLWEVGCEELPAWACDAIERQLPQLVGAALAEARLDVPDSELAIYVGPRRFAIVVPVLDAQRSEHVERRGPAVGAPEQAVAGFARSAGLAPDQLEQREENGRSFWFASYTTSSEPFSAVWPTLAEQIVGRLQFAKPMKWGDTEHRFVRPIRWVCTMLGDEPLSYDLWGVTSSNVSRGHRFLSAVPQVQVPNVSKYADTLRAANVEIDQAARRSAITDALAGAAAEAGGSWEDPAGVLDEVVHLVEWPTVVLGRFDDRYLDLPERVLVTAMQSHQRYLPVRATDGSLAAAFLTAMNGDPAAVEQIRPGYERVLVGRLDDAVFSFERDRERGLDDMAASLDAVVFHAKAGSLADRSSRIRTIAAEIARELGESVARASVVDDAARLAKADQVSYVVQEFAELEGFAGSLYAASHGYDDAIVRAIDQQFLPRSADGKLPDAGVPAIVALADKFDLLVTIWSIGEPPTGSRDPHGLRRAAIGITRIVLEYGYELEIDTVLRVAADALEAQGHAAPSVEVMEALRSFIDDRVEKQLTADGLRGDAVRAARAARPVRLQDLVSLSTALASRADADDADFAAVLDAERRCRKLLEKQEPTDAGSQVDVKLLATDAERTLLHAVDEVAAEVVRRLRERDCDGAVRSGAQLGAPLARFFDRDEGVLVMAEDPAIRRNRLALLARVVDAVAPLGDLTELQV